MIRIANKASDWDAIREICCLTGSNGSPIEKGAWKFFSELWIGPYQRLAKDWTYVCELEGEIAGYLTGCPNSARFALKKKILFTPMLLAQVLFREYSDTADTRRFIKRTLKLERSPEDIFSAELNQKIKKDFPAHLHINLREKFRGKNIGRELCEKFFDRIRLQKISGVHVYCGRDPVPFYKKLGFEELETREFKPGYAVFVMGLNLK